MSLDNIQLQPIMLAELFNKSLVDLKDKQQLNVTATIPIFAFLGKNEKNIAILVNNGGYAYLPENELTLLQEIMQACKCTLQDIAVVNIASKNINNELLINELQYNKMILFGVPLSAIDLPINIPYYQMQQYDNKVYISSPPLQSLISNRDEKKQLWLGLKKMFEL